MRLSVLRRLDGWLFKALRAAVGTVLAVMFLVVVVGVVARYAFAAPIFWIEELARYLMFYLVLLGAAVALRSDIHPRLTLILDRLPAGTRHAWSVLLDLGLAILLVVVLLEGLAMAVDEAIMRTPALRLSFFWVYLALPIGAALMLLQLVLRYAFGVRREDSQL